MSTEINSPATDTGKTTVKENAPVIPGRNEVLEHFAQEIEGAFKTPGEKVVAAKAGDEKLVLSQDKTDEKVEVAETPEQKTEREATEATALAERAKASGMTVEEQKTAEAQALTELTERAKAAGKTIEEQFAIEEAAENGEADHLAEDAELKKELTPETQEKINRRIGKEVAKTKLAQEAADAVKAELAEAQRQLAERPQVQVPRSPVPLGNVNDEAGLKAEEAKANEAIDQCDALTLQLDDDPASVEAVLKDAKVELPEYTPAAMKRYLAQIKANATKTVRTAIPQRAEFLKKASEFKSEAVTIMPELKDPKSPRRARFEKVLGNFPELKDHPFWATAAAVQVLGLERLDEINAAAAAKGKAPVKPVVRVKPVVIPAPRAQPAAAPKAAKKGEVSDETKTAALNGDKNARRKILEGLL
jgi:hypothetical protein